MEGEKNRSRVKKTLSIYAYDSVYIYFVIIINSNEIRRALNSRENDMLSLNDGK